MSITNKFDISFGLNYFAKSSLYQCTVPSQPMFDTVLLAQINIISLVQISCFSRLFCKKRVSIKIVSILRQLFYWSFVKLSFEGLNLEFYKSKGSRHSFQKPKIVAQSSPFWSLIYKVNINRIPFALLIFWQYRTNTFASSS